MAFHSGIGTHVRGLIGAMAEIKSRTTEAFPAFTFLGDPDALVGVRGMASLGEIQSCSLPVYSWGERFLFPKTGATVTHFPHYNVPAFLRGMNYIVTAHDVTHLIVPECRLSLASRVRQLILLGPTLRSARHVITVSERSRQDVIEVLGVAPEKITVIANAVDPQFGSVPDGVAEKYRDRLGLKLPYFLSVGVGAPQKNFPFLIKAYAAWRRRNTAMPHVLVICGPDGTSRERLNAEVVASGAEAYVTIAGPQTHEDLRALYQDAEALIVPSLYEGFGIPVLESQRLGVPVLCSRAGALTETAGESVLYFDPRSADELAHALTRYLDGGDTLRQQLVAAGRQNEQRFSWERSAELLLSLYRDCV